MIDSVSSELINSLSNCILNFNYNGTSPGLSFLKKHVRSKKFTATVDSIITQKQYTCRNTLLLCEDILNIMINGCIEDWLDVIYRYAVGLSFPHLCEEELSENIILASKLYLELLHIVSEAQKNSKDSSFQSGFPLNLIDEDFKNGITLSDEYIAFKESFRNDYIYEMMKLNHELLGYNTLDHICCVHFLAVHIGTQFLRKGIPVDMGRVSGAAAGHDIGKYGCSKDESSRVAYLHYFYTDMWFKKHNIDYIGHIAVNHSTWDLELENLPVESLILIYCDFRVKNKIMGDGSVEMNIFSLKESFDVILDKLDNLDSKKIKRYERVYSKLMDFENYMESLGFNLNPEEDCENTKPRETNTYTTSLVQGKYIVDNFKNFSINHNINLMYKLRDEPSLNAILEQARSQSDWKNLRQYLYIFEEYSTYLTQKQKLITLKFLYENLTHSEEDIRKKSSDLIGKLIANYDIEYRKERPKNLMVDRLEQSSWNLFDQYLNSLTSPDHKLIPLHKKWINHSIITITGSVFRNSSPSKAEEYRRVFSKYISKDINKNNDLRISLLKSIAVIPHASDDEFKRISSSYISLMLLNSNPQVRISALDSALEVIEYNKFLKSEIEGIFSGSFTQSKYPAENYLRLKLSSKMDLDENIRNIFTEYFVGDYDKMPDIYLSNLKTDTDWILKKVNINMLFEFSLQNIKEHGFYTAMHFCNLLKVSEIEAVRNNAGEALIKLIPYLSFEQRNDVAIELIRALEIEGYPFAEFIPYFLGQVILFLKPSEFDEFIDEFIKKIKQSEPRICSLLLNTIGVSLSQYPRYRSNFSIREKTNKKLLIKSLGVLLNGLVNYNVQVRQVAFRTLGKDIFNSKYLTLEQKYLIFSFCAKKILTLLKDSNEDELEFLINSAGLNHIYRFISDYIFTNENIYIPINKKVAFFPGTFDPFSLSHKEIALEIQNLGFEVYLAVDEFSWSKRTLPNIIRRNIINMSVADQLNIFLYPEDIPINISNPEDLKKLKDSFGDSDVYIVVGTDVVENASAYKERLVLEGAPSIHNFNHIIFERISSDTANKNRDILLNNMNKIDGEIIKLNLPPQYENISSTQIRSYIDQDRDITSLIDPLVQKYIYENGFYQSEPQFKTILSQTNINIEMVEKPGLALINEIKPLLQSSADSLYLKIKEISSKPSSRALVLRESQNNRIVGFSLVHWLRTNKIFQEFKDSRLSQYIRENSIGRILCIDALFTDSSYNELNLNQILLAETISFSLAKDYDYAVFKDIINETTPDYIQETLELFGFIKIHGDSPQSTIFTVNMNTPCTLDLDLITVIKEPYRSNPNIVSAILEARKKLQLAITKLYPGQLVISFERSMLYYNLIKKVCKENKVPTQAIIPRKLGKSICVPFGNILKGNVVPNTVTKSLHTEKFFRPDLKSYEIGPYPYYPDFNYQIRMIKSFGKPVILVDDILHKGYRLNAIYPILDRENVEVQKIIVGILSGRGKEIADAQGKSVDSVYFIPKLKVWFNESALYPFMGGDALWRGVSPERNLIPSVNLILPYTSPSFIRGASKESLYHLSEVCIENSLSILQAIEKEYQMEKERGFTISQLGKIFLYPRCPDKGKDMHYDLNLSPSNYIKNDLEQLKRLESILK